MIIACASEGQWLLFLTKNGLLSKVIIKKDARALKEDKNFKLFDVQFHSQVDISNHVKNFNLDEKNCNLSYDPHKKSFVLSYVAADGNNHFIKHCFDLFLLVFSYIY